VQPEFTSRELHRVEFETLVTHAEAALRARDFARATPLLREAVRRAPFRQDLRDKLADSLQANLAGGGRRTPPATPARRPTAPPAPPAPETQRPPIPQPGPAASPRHEPERRTTAPPPPIADERRRPAPPPTAPPIHEPPPATAFRPAAGQRVALPKGPPVGEFSHRHRRGPLSAMLLGILVGILLMAAIAAFGFYYWQKTGEGPQEDVIARADINATIEQARLYSERGEFAKAIEQLNTLPAIPIRDSHLANIYMDKGDRALTSRPQQLKAAIDAYGEAVALKPDVPRYALALGQAYYMLAISQSDDEEAMRRNLLLARQTYEALLDRHPNHLEALNELAKVAGKLKDPVLQAKTYRTIIEVAPEGSPAALEARRNLESLGFKY